MTLLARLLLLVSLALVPSLFLQVYAEREASAAREQLVADEALRLARLVAAEHGAVVEGARQLLSALGTAPAVRAGDPAACAAYSADLLREFPRYAIISAADRSGRIVCTAHPNGPGQGVGDRAWFRTALDRDRFVIGEYIIGRGSGRASISFSQPWRDVEGQAAGVVVAALDLGWLGEQLEGIPLPPGSAAVLLDRNGTVLAARPGNRGLVGQPAPPEFRDLLGRPREGVAMLTHLDGIGRVTGYAPLEGASGGLLVAVGVDNATMAQAARMDRLAIGLIVVGAAIALLLTAFGMRRIVREPVAELLQAASAWRAGDLSARVAGRVDGHGRSEFRRLAAAFDAMAGALETREATAAREVRQRALLLQVSRDILGGSRDEAGLAALLHDRVAGHLDADILLSFAVQPDGGALRLVAAQGLPEAAQAQLRVLPVGEGFCADVAASGRSLVADAAAIAREACAAALHAAGARAYVGYPLVGADGRVLGTLAFASTRRDRFGPDDVAFVQTLSHLVALAWQRRQAEEAVRESETRLRFALEAGRMGVWDWEVATGRLDWDRRQFELFGLDPKAGTPGFAAVMQRIHPEDRPRLEAAIREALTVGDAAFSAEFRAMHPDGPRWIAAHGHAIPGPDGRALRMVGLNFDITDRMEAAAVLARGREELERLIAERTEALQASEARLAEAARMEALGRLAGGIAHDFNNVLQAVQGGISLAARRLTRDPEAATRFLELAEDAAARGAAVTGRLLAFARRGELSAAAVQPGPLLEGLAQILRHTLGPSVALEIEAEEGLPPLLADAGQLEAALVNLANNARDALPGGVGTVTLRADHATVPPGAAVAPVGLAPGDYLRLSVLDDGEGMPPEVVARVTEPFFTTKPQGKGTGLGLSMARGFAEQSGGALSIESRPGRGTAVSLWLPRAPVGEAPGRAPPEPAPPRTEEGRAASVLLVDDEGGVRTVVAAALADRGHRVAEAADAATALARLDAGLDPDVLVTDLAMPGAMDGLALLREARRRRPGLPAVLITGHAGDAARLALREAATGGPFALLRKPASATLIGAEITAVLREAARRDTTVVGGS